MTASSPGSTVNYFTQDWGSTFDWFKKPAQNTGKKMAFDPASLAIAGLGAGFGALSGYGQQLASNKAIERQLQFQGDALKEGILFQRDSGKANIGLGMFGQIWGSTTGADLDLGRQVLAKRREFAEFMPKESGLAREGARWDLDFKSGPAFKNYTRQENLLNLQSNPTLIADRAAKTGLFGRIAQAPIESLMV